MDKQFHPALHWVCVYLSMLGLKLNLAGKRGHRGCNNQTVLLPSLGLQTTWEYRHVLNNSMKDRVSSCFQEIVGAKLWFSLLTVVLKPSSVLYQNPKWHPIRSHMFWSGLGVLTICPLFKTQTLEDNISFFHCMALVVFWFKFNNDLFAGHGLARTGDKLLAESMMG